MMYNWVCKHCGRANKSTAIYCYNCDRNITGNKLRPKIKDGPINNIEIPDMFKDIFKGFYNE